MRKLFIVIIGILVIAETYGQQVQISGKVTASSDGEELVGVTVRVAGASTATLTDADGNYQISVPQGTKLEFSYIGYKKRTFTITNQRILNVSLSEDENLLDEVMIVGYGGGVKKVSLTGAVSAIAAKELKYIPTSSINNMLYGKLPGLFSVQRSGQPGRDASDFFIRGVSSLNSDGNRPLIIVDDIEYSYEQLQQINVNEVESISILKDASTTAIYGIKGANGVLIVKTRRGSTGKPEIGVRVEAGIQMPVRTPKFLNSYHTAILMNEALVNDGLTPRFTPEDLDHFQLGDSPYTHPDVNWYEEIFKKVAEQRNFNIDVSGGDDRLKYFITAGYFWQNGLPRNFPDPLGDVNTSYFYRRTNYRTNLDLQVTKTLNMRLDFNARLMDINSPVQFGTLGAIYNFSEMRPYTSPMLNPNGTYSFHFDTPNQSPTLNARLAMEGNRRDRRYDYNILYGATQKLDFITNGLSAKIHVAYSSQDENYRSPRRHSGWPIMYPTYFYHQVIDPDTGADMSWYELHPRSDSHDISPYMIAAGQNFIVKNINLQAFLNYERNFNEVHDLKVMVLFNRQSKVEHHGNAIPINFQGITNTINYNYKSKFMIDYNMGYNGTDRFIKGNRYGFFPAVGLGYNLAEEMFIKDNYAFIKLLKLRASYGLVGSDAAPGNRYVYKQLYYHGGGGYAMGEKAEGIAITDEGGLGNDLVVWEKARKVNVGVDANIRNHFNFTIDFFYDYRYDQLIYRGDLPFILGVGGPPTNEGITSNKGFDGNVGYRNSFGDFGFNTNLVFSYAKNKIIKNASPNYKYPWLSRVGHPIGQPFGFTFDGFYTPEEIEKIYDPNRDPSDKSIPVPITSVQLQAGDMKYRDLNGDGVIDEYDRGPIGKPNLPNTTLGWTIGGSYKGFSLSVLFQGSFNYSFSIIGTGIEPFRSQFQPAHLLRWTKERYEAGEKIDFPRLTTMGNTINSSGTYMSNFWLIDAWYMRLKTVDLNYQIPKKALPRGIENARFYLTAYNLFTKTNYERYQQDPEISSNTAGDAYMNQRVINLGLQFTF